MKNLFYFSFFIVFSVSTGILANDFKYFRESNAKSAETLPKGSVLYFLTAKTFFETMVILKNGKLFEIDKPIEGFKLNIVSSGSIPKYSIVNFTNFTLEKSISLANIISWYDSHSKSESLCPTHVVANINSKTYRGCFKINNCWVHQVYIITFKKIDDFGDSITVIDKLIRIDSLFKEKPEGLKETGSEQISREQEMERTVKSVNKQNQYPVVATSTLKGEWRGFDVNGETTTISFIESIINKFDITLKINRDIYSGYCNEMAGNLLVLKLNSIELSNVDCTWITEMDGDTLLIKHIGTGLFSGQQNFKLTKTK